MFTYPGPMDDQVVKALKKWPDVPHIYGYLSLSEQGVWHIHPDGQAIEQPDSKGLALQKNSITTFINRNYATDQAGCWYFQNGPQRVYVRLDAAPFIVHTAGDNKSLCTHTGQAVKRIFSWYLSHDDRLYLSTDVGPAMLQGRDLCVFAEQLHTARADTLLDWLEQHPNHVGLGPTLRSTHYPQWAPLYICGAQEAVKDKLAYIACPQAIETQ